jgi:hypothetical protein
MKFTGCKTDHNGFSFTKVTMRIIDYMRKEKVKKAA